MLDVLLTGSVSFIITFLAIPIVLQIAEEKKLFDVPDERKIHKVPVAFSWWGGYFWWLFISLASFHFRF